MKFTNLNKTEIVNFSKEIFIMMMLELILQFSSNFDIRKIAQIQCKLWKIQVEFLQEAKFRDNQSSTVKSNRKHLENKNSGFHLTRRNSQKNQRYLKKKTILFELYKVNLLLKKNLTN